MGDVCAVLQYMQRTWEVSSQGALSMWKVRSCAQEYSMQLWLATITCTWRHLVVLHQQQVHQLHVAQLQHTPRHNADILLLPSRAAETLIQPVCESHDPRDDQ